jgi:outer membrane protein TolC
MRVVADWATSGKYLCFALSLIFPRVRGSFLLVNRMSRAFRLLALLPVACSLAIAGGGCTRSGYRKQADRDVAAAILGKEQQLGIGMLSSHTAAAPGPESRFFDPSDPDYPPMPVDDPVSHGQMAKAGVGFWNQPPREGAAEHSVWRNLLRRGGDGEWVLDLPSAVRVGILNSREFQNEREDLYLSALDVTFERFQFSPQFALGNSTQFSVDGQLRRGRPPAGVRPQEAQRLGVLTDGNVRWLTATGGELLAGFANSLVWDFRGDAATQISGSLLNFSVVQPLLRLGGRARTLESLTQSERTLLANVRQMEQFQHGFYVRLAAGRFSGEGPSRRGAVGGGGLGVLAGTPSGRTGAPRAEGFLGLLEDQQRIRNLEANVARLRESLDQLAAAFDAGRISSRLQVDQARQALFNGQSSLLSSRAAYQSRVDTYKMELGLPPGLEVEFRDSLLEQWIPSDPAATALDRRIEGIEDQLRRPERFSSLEQLSASVEQLAALEESFRSLLRVAEKDLERLRRGLPARHRHLERLRRSPGVRDLSIEPERLEDEALDKRVAQIEQRLARQRLELDQMLGELRKCREGLSGMELEPARAQLSELASEFSGLLLSLSLDQTATRLETATLMPVDLAEGPALEIARTHRLDWMNARANLVDVWRRIGFAANPLMSGLDLTLDGNMGTVRNGATRLDGRTGLLRAGLRFDSPLNRLAERNDYREALLAYQRARRDYQLFEDRVSQSLRNTLRIVQLCELNFELRRSAVQVAISQVDLARLRLREPPRPGVQATIGATTARDLVSALNDLLDAQNDFLSLQVGYNVLRLALDFELGTMQLNTDGLWMDPGPITASELAARRPQWRELPADSSTHPEPARLAFRQSNPSVR